jgi:tetratricopeptide (TPR) repeat protein
VINRFSGKGEQFQVCQCYRILGEVYCFRNETEKATDHLEIALEIASSFNWHDMLFWIHHSLAKLRSDEGRFGDAHTHIEHAKSHAANDAYNQGRAAELQARFWYRKQRFEEAGSAASHAADILERLGAMADTKCCRALFEMIEHRDD